MNLPNIASVALPRTRAELPPWETGATWLGAARASGGLAVLRKVDAAPRLVAFDVHAFQVAVNRGTGEVAIHRSIHAADASRVLNPMHCRGQVEGGVEGGVAQAPGAALHEAVRIEAAGAQPGVPGLPRACLGRHPP